MINAATQPQISVPPAGLHRLAQAGPLDLLDVRTPAEFAAAHVPGAALLPLESLDAAAFLKLRGDESKPIYILCQTGGRARKAIEKFQRAGFENCVLVEGGTQAWIDAGLPIVRGAGGTLPLMRQVQLTVGAISALGAALALAIDHRFAIVPLVTGCGLFFAGLTGFCGLALLLAKMPWNRRAAVNSTSSRGDK
jgi:rhodanese-related sulfurtransferase